MAKCYLRFPGGLSRALTLSYDDGVDTDRRLIEIMKKNGLKGTFNLNSGCFSAEGTVRPAGAFFSRMSRSDSLALYRDSGMEVAVHTYLHTWISELPSVLLLEEIARDRRELEGMFGTVIRGGAYPFGAYNDEIVGALRACGIVYCRTTVSTGKFDIPTDWLRLPATCHHKDERLFDLCDKFLENTAFDRPYLFYLWGHSFEFEKDRNWNRIEEFAARMGNRDDIWYATNIEVYDYVDAYRRLQFSLDGTRVHNPSALTVWFFTDKGTFSVAPGETLSFA